MFKGAQVTLFRRMAAVAIDWLACLLITKGFRLEGAFTILLIFFLEVTILITLSGASFGHRLMGMKVVQFKNGAPPTPLQTLIRNLLLCTVVFAITYDEDGRGIHERLSGTYLVKTY